MIHILKNIHITIMILSLIVMSQAHGDYSNVSRNREFENCCSCASNYYEKGFLSADLLYWRAFQDGLDECFPIEQFDDVSSDGNIISKFRGKGKDPHFNWEAGFRLGTGYEFACGLDIAAYWTHFHSHSNESHKNEYQYWNKHKLRWKLDFEVVDIIVGREFDLRSCFTLYPFAGLRGARIEQNFRTNFFSKAGTYFESNSAIPSLDFNSSSYSNGFTISNTHSKQRLLGIGPLVGIRGDWNLGCDFSLYANVSVAILYGNFHIRLNNVEQFVNGDDYCKVKRNLYACQAVFDAGFGIRWQTCLCGNTLWLQLGLEHHRYFNQNRFRDYGDLCLDGANFSVGIAF